MKLSKAQAALGEMEWSLLVNGNCQSPNGDVLIVTNEQANLLCSRFKPNYKVIGILPINVQKRTIYFLVNPVTNKSEIGYINNISYNDVSDPSVDCKDCNHPITEKELNPTTELCNYTTIVNADCLNFNINYPISATYEIGVDINTTESDSTNTTIFFTDYLNKRRYMNISNYPRVNLSEPCENPVYLDELDCNAINIVPAYSDPCIKVIDTPLGGSNKAGVYQFATTYSNIKGEALTDYSLITNPLPLSSQNRVITVNTDYDTNKSIKIQLNDVDTNFNYINIVVIKTINQLTEAFLVATLPIESDTLTYTYSGDNYQKEIRVTFDEILRKKGIYEYSKYVDSANKFLFWYDLKDQRQINLQPVVSQIPLKWQTEEALEGFYKNPISANYVSYERDEVVPFGIEFGMNNGYKLPTFLFIGKPKEYYLNNYNIDVDQSVGSDPNALSSEGCEPELLNKLWQVYNVIPPASGSTCYSNPSGETIVKIPILSTCFSELFEFDASGNTDVPPCCSGDICNETSEDYCCCELVEVTASGTIEIPVYECNSLELATPAPPYSTIPEFDPGFFWACGDLPPSSSGDTWVPDNTNCSRAETIFPNSDNSCFKPTVACYRDGTSDVQSLTTLPYLYFNEYNKPSEYYPCYNLSGSPVTAYANEQWLTFTAISNNHLLTVSCLNNFEVVVLEGDDCDNLIQVVNHAPDNYPTCDSANGEETLCITLNNLTEGNTYYVRVVITESISGKQAQEMIEGTSYGNYCLNTPIPQSYIEFDEKAQYRWECSYFDGYEEPITVPVESTCLITPFEYGEFAYWESTANYPDNKEIWGDLACQPIRHHKFPDCCGSHIHNSNPEKYNIGQLNRIYPIGVRLDINDVKQALNDAVIQGLISEEEKLQIISYSIKRGNRRNNRSVLAKGLLYDVWKTPILDSEGYPLSGLQKDQQYYPNYPYNDLNADNLLLYNYQGRPIKHPFSTAQYHNNRYTFHSPNTSFNKPTLGYEIKLETVEGGKFLGTANEVEKHAKYTILTNSAYALAKTMAAFQINHEASAAASAAGDGISVLGTGAGSIITYAIEYAINVGLGFAANFQTYTNNYLEIIRNFGNPKNPALYLTSIGIYSDYCCVTNENEFIPKRRKITNYRYLNPGNYEWNEQGYTIRFNNYERESSVYLSIFDSALSSDGFFLKPSLATSGCFLATDNSRQKNCKKNGLISGNIMSYYASIKDYKPDQYGTVDQIEWIDTGYCGAIEWDNPNQDTTCDTIFGGDTFINRFSLKRKFPFFTQDAVGLAENSPIQYSELTNVGFPRYFFNSLQNQQSLQKAKLPFLAPPLTKFDTSCELPKETGKIYLYQNGKVYLYDYGIPSFICESDYNVDLRHGEDEGNYKDFYPHVADIVQWTQQYKNPISFDNTYYYNPDYSKQNVENFYHILSNSYSQTLSYIQSQLPNRTIYSGQGAQLWKQYLAADYYDFPLEDGKLIGLNGIEQQAVFVRQENSASVFNAFITQETSLEQIQISIGNIFAQKPRQYFKTDLGFGGSTNNTLISTPLGHFYVDTQNPSIFQLQGDSLKDITRDKETHNKIQWFVENLPFNISKQFSEVDTDNNYKYFGIALTWDNKYDKLIITKLDYKVKPEFTKDITYLNNEFYLNNQIVYPYNPLYFENKSWTIGFNPSLQEWISFYSFKPNYYTNNEEYFSSGINYSNDITEYGVWNHGLTDKLYNVFYGKSYPFILEYGLKTNYQSNILNSVETNVEFRRYQSDLNYFNKSDVFYNKALIYNQTASSGELNLSVKKKNNIFDAINSSNQTGTGTNLKVDNIENFWRFNGFYDLYRNNGQPNMIYNNPMYKTLNPLSVDYSPKYFKNNLRGDYFLIRLESNQNLYRVEHRFTINQTSKSSI